MMFLLPSMRSAIILDREEVRYVLHTHLSSTNTESDDDDVKPILA